MRQNRWSPDPIFHVTCSLQTSFLSSPTCIRTAKLVRWLQAQMVSLSFDFTNEHPFVDHDPLTADLKTGYNDLSHLDIVCHFCKLGYLLGVVHMRRFAHAPEWNSSTGAKTGVNSFRYYIFWWQYAKGEQEGIRPSGRKLVRKVVNTLFKIEQAIQNKQLLSRTWL